MKKALFALFLTFFTPITFAEGTRSWTQDSYDEFARGTTRNVAISSRGVLELAPAFKQVYSASSTFLWAIAAGSDGAVFVAGGSPAKVYRLESDGSAQTIFEPKELQVQS